MEALADTVGLRAVGLGARVVDVLNRQVELIGMVFDLAAILGATVGQDAQQRYTCLLYTSPSPRDQ